MRSLLPILFFAAAAPCQEDPFPEVGKPAPVFTAKDHDDKDVKVGGPSKTWTVLAFYPKALTGG